MMQLPYGDFDKACVSELGTHTDRMLAFMLRSEDVRRESGLSDFIAPVRGVIESDFRRREHLLGLLTEAVWPGVS